MLKRLRVRGLALLSDVTLELGPGLNVLTGETGAGKSLLVFALASLLGKAPALASARAGTAEILIEAELWASANAKTAAAPASVVLEVKGSRSRASLDGKALPLAELHRLLRQSLVLTVQGAARELASPSGVLALLDTRAGTAQKLREYRTRRAEWLRARSRIEALRAELSTKGERGERIASLLEELSELAPRPREHAELVRRIELVSRRQHYLELCARIQDAVTEREPSIESELSHLLSAVRRAPAHGALAELGDGLADALAALAVVGQRATRIASDLEADPAELPVLEQRRDALERLGLRLGRAPDELADGASGLEAELERLELLERHLAELEAASAAKEAEARTLAEALRVGRERGLTGLTRDLQRELVSLSLEGAALELALEARAEPLASDEPQRLRLGFSANAGQPLLPLERVASGGERSRFVLALACAGAAAGCTLVFDEIDQGVGGEALARLAARLGLLARSQQILCVTHQAPIAARAETHFRVEKITRAGVTSTSVTRLDDDERTLELSRMLAGGRAADGARALARHLLAEARSAA